MSIAAFYTAARSRAWRQTKHWSRSVDHDGSGVFGGLSCSFSQYIDGWGLMAWQPNAGRICNMAERLSWSMDERRIRC